MALVLRSREGIFMIYFEYKETIIQRKTSKGTEEHTQYLSKIYEEINGKKSILRLEYFASRLFVLRGCQCQNIYLCTYKINKLLHRWLAYDFYYALVVKDC